MRVEDSMAERYHRATKYTYEGVTGQQKHLDWSKQPPVFKEIRGAQRVPLAEHLPDLSADAPAAPLPAPDPDAPTDVARLSRMLYFTNGVTRVVQVPGQPFFMRAAPSAGGLYPTEVYVATRGVGGLADGIHNYQVKDHALALLWEGDFSSEISRYAFDHPAVAAASAVVILTGIFYRSSWRYEERAYRRILLDTGHVLGNLAFYAPFEGHAAVPIGGFADEAIDGLLFLDEGEEVALVLAPLLPLSRAAALPPGGRAARPSPTPGGLDVPEGEGVMKALHRASRSGPTPATTPFAGGSDMPTDRFINEKYAFASGAPIDGEAIEWGAEARRTIVRRRSTRGYSGEPISKGELAAALDFTYRPDAHDAPGDPLAAAARPRFFDPSIIETFVAAARVDGLEPGLYYYAPGYRELRAIKRGPLSDELHYVCLWQDLGRDAAAVVFHTADLPRAVQKYGDRAYRYLHLDAGHLGQRLNLAMIRLGLGVSGIGGFFDDDINGLLGIPEREAVVYVTTLGRPADE